MPDNADHFREPIKSVAIVGTGLIGGTWAAYFLSRGLDVRAWDVSEAARARLHDTVDAAMVDLIALGEGPPVEPGAVSICDSLEATLEGVDYVQENGPEDLEVKQGLIARIDALLPKDVIIASSTSSLKATDMQRDCRHPERVIVAHPFNPPHLLPLVELVRGEKTAAGAQDAAMRFFEGIGKVPIRVRKEAVGHVANRMTAALWREAVHIVAEDIASVEDVDKAIRYGPGLRWAIDGPHMLYHLGGGAGGIRQYLEHLGPAQERRWATLGTPTLDEEVKRKLIEGIEEEAAGRSLEDLARRRDEALIDILRALVKHETR